MADAILDNPDRREGDTRRQGSDHRQQQGDHLDRFIREPERYRLTGISRVQWWRLERQGRAPARIQLSDNIVAWSERELCAWMEARAAERQRGT